MQYSLAKLVAVTTVAAVLFGAIRSVEMVGPLSFILGLGLLGCSGIAYPLVILGSPQKGTQLDPSSNPAMPYVHLMAATGATLMTFFIVADPFRFFYR